MFKKMAEISQYRRALDVWSSADLTKSSIPFETYGRRPAGEYNARRQAEAQLPQTKTLEPILKREYPALSVVPQDPESGNNACLRFMH